MEVLVLLAVAAVVGVPLIAIAALVRASGLRQLIDSQSAENSSAISALKAEIAVLRQSLERLSSQPSPQPVDILPPASVVATTPPPATETSIPVEALASSIPASALLAEAVAAPEEPPVAAEPIFAKEDPTPPPLPEEIAAVPEPPRSWDDELRPAAPPAFDPPSFGQPLATEPPRPGFLEGLLAGLRSALPLEEVLGMNLFAKIGMVLLVLGFALLGRKAMIAMGPGGKVALLYAVGAGLLGGGIWLERRERYRLIGRTGIGGGWALLFFTTYAMHHVAAMRVLGSQTLDCALLLGVAAAMVAHTLRYRSQVVTGLAFLLAFSTVALSQDTVYSLAAGVILAVAVVAIALREGWYELEIFGILASYANHFYWLYRLYPEGMAGHAFPAFWPSAVILVLYWLAFRVSYVARAIRTSTEERASAIAGLLNPVLLLAAMKFQSTRPELAFYALLGLGAAEFLFGQLPATRRRRAAFILLTILGTALMLAAVPFKFSGNSIALLWMIAAEMLLVAGIAQREVVFRRLGLLTGVFTGALVVFEARGRVELGQSSPAPLPQSGILLLTCAALFYLNALFAGRKWRQLFFGLDGGFDGSLTTAHSYIGGATAFIGVWALLAGDWTALGWAALMLAAALGARRLLDRQLAVQSGFFAGSVAVQAALTNLHLDAPYPNHPWGRAAGLPALAALFYLAAAALPAKQEPLEDIAAPLRVAALWLGTALLACLAWLDVAPVWLALVWMALAVALALVSRRVRLASFCYQEHILAALVGYQLAAVNLGAGGAFSRYASFHGCAAALYAISRLCTFPDAAHRRLAAWAHTCGGTALLAALAWQESAPLWVAVAWALFALGLALVDRKFDVEELPWQAHVLAAMAVVRAVALNLQASDRWRGIDLRLLTVSIIAAALYCLAARVRMPPPPRGRELRHLYSWAGSILAAWMLWSELPRIGAAPGLAAFGLILFEWGLLRRQRQIRLQGYAALAVAFGRIFFVNLTAARLPGEAVSAAILSVVPIALIDFAIWWQLQAEKPDAAGGFAVDNLLAYFGSFSIAALLYCQTTSEWTVAAWAAMAVGLLAAALWLRKEVFSQQAALLLFATVCRGVGCNLLQGGNSTAADWRGPLPLAITLQLAALPVAFPLRRRYAALPPEANWARYLGMRRPEQVFFFAPAALAALAIAVKMNPGVVTLAWGVEGLLVILLGIAAAQRTYRITGLLLLLLCVAKIVVRDAWHLAERDRYITFIALGAALTAVSMLYNRFRESIRRLL
jgi:hypothetical protein